MVSEFSRVHLSAIPLGEMRTCTFCGSRLRAWYLLVGNSCKPSFVTGCWVGGSTPTISSNNSPRIYEIWISYDTPYSILMTFFMDIIDHQILYWEPYRFPYPPQDTLESMMIFRTSRLLGYVIVLFSLGSTPISPGFVVCV